MNSQSNQQNKINPVLLETIKEGFTDTIGSLARELGSRFAAHVHELGRSSAESNIRHLRSLEDKLLLPQYARHLGISTGKIRTILNEYEKNPPLQIIPHPLYTPGGKYPQAIRNPDYDRHMAEFREREKLKNAIKGLHRSIPHLRQLHDDISSGLASSFKEREEADPTMERPIGMPADRKIRKIRKSTYLRKYADILKARRR